MTKKNIVEVYLEQKKQFIIVLIGLPGSDIEQLSIDLSKNLNFNMINTIHFLKNKDVKNIDDFDKEALNKKVNKLKKKGIIICTNFFPKKFISSKIDFTININISKKISLNKNPKLENSFFSLYYDSLKETYINKYINIKNNEDPYNTIFDSLMEYVSCKIDDGNYKNKIICKKIDYDQEKIKEINKKQKKNHNKPKKKLDKLNSTDSEINTTDSDMNTTDSDISDMNTTDSDVSEMNTTDSDMNTTNSEMNISESDINTTDSDIGKK